MPTGHFRIKFAFTQEQTGEKLSQGTVTGLKVSWGMGFLVIFLSESGYPGFEDVQDCDLFVNVGRIFFSIIGKFLFCLNQDIQDLRMYRIVICELINHYFQIVK